MKILKKTALCLMMIASAAGLAACGAENGPAGVVWTNINAKEAFTYQPDLAEEIADGVILTFNEGNSGSAWRLKQWVKSIKFDAAADLADGEYVVFVVSYNKIAATEGNNGTGFSVEEDNEARIGFAKFGGQIYVGPVAQGISHGNTAETVATIVGAGHAIDGFDKVRFDFNTDEKTATAHGGGKSFESWIPAAAQEIRVLWVLGNAESVTLTNLKVVK